MLSKYQRNIWAIGNGLFSKTGFAFSSKCKTFVSKSRNVNAKLNSQPAFTKLREMNSFSLTTTLRYNFSDSYVSLIHSLQ